MMRQLVVTAVLVPLAGALAQSQAPLTLRVNSQLVEISAVVTDSHGNPVADLKPGDFEVYDKGKKQEIRLFHADSYRHTTAVNKPEVASALAPAAPGVFSNRLPMEPGVANPATAIVIDAGSTWDTARMTWPDLVYAREQLIQFLRQVHPEDRLGIYLMGPRRFWILREYNQRCAELLERLATWHTSEEAPAVAKAPDVWAEFAMHFAGVDAATAKAIHRDQFWTSRAGGGEALPEGMVDSSDPTVPTAHGRQGSLAAATGSGPVLGALDPAAYLSGSLPGRQIVLPRDQEGPLAVLEAAAHHLESVPGRKFAPS
jgi:VWFA-related protein